MSDYMVYRGARMKLNKLTPSQAERFLDDRETSHAFASARGYFWLPCPCCGNHFGGHEWDGTSVDGHGGVCPWCAFHVYRMQCSRTFFACKGFAIGENGLEPLTHLRVTLADAKGAVFGGQYAPQ